MGGVITQKADKDMGNEYSFPEEDGPGLKLRVLSWNIDGLDGENIKERTETACQLIKAKQPHVVFLQEVVLETLRILRYKLSTDYKIYHSHTLKFGYFPAILITNRSSKIKVDGDIGSFDFPGSTMGRHLLQLFIEASGVPIALYTSHLESLRDYSKERKDQLCQCFEFIKEQNELFHRVCLLGGDLNLRDEEVKEVGLPPSMVDVWEACGSSEEHRYTWDLTTNKNKKPFGRSLPRLRFDRFYLSPGDGQFVRPSHFELIGKELIQGINRHPSDHYGMWCEFDVSELITTDD